jgi:hypothetical protein
MRRTTTGGSGDDDHHHHYQSEKEDVSDVSKSGEGKKREHGAIVAERMRETTAGLIDSGNGVVVQVDV